MYFQRIQKIRTNKKLEQKPRTPNEKKVEVKSDYGFTLQTFEKLFKEVLGKRLSDMNCDNLKNFLHSQNACYFRSSPYKFESCKFESKKHFISNSMFLFQSNQGDLELCTLNSHQERNLIYLYLIDEFKQKHQIV